MSAAPRAHAAPPASPFTEHPLSEASKPKSPARWSPVQGELKPPDGFYPVRAERSGKRVLLLALSQRLDPTGEVSGGGYWLLESKDGGRTWDSLSSRTVVLTEEELSAAEERFGRFYPLRVDLQLNAKGDQALIQWDEHWRGGSYEARKKDGQWVLEARGGWIT